MQGVRSSGVQEFRRKEEGRRKKEEGRRKKEYGLRHASLSGGRKKEEVN